MRDFNTQAILLKKYKVSEADLSLVVLTEKFGKINLWMKGVRKNDQKYGSFIDFFSIMEIGIYKQKTKDKNILKNIKIIEHNYNTRCDLTKFNIASFMLSAVNKMTEAETGEEVFELLKYSLLLLDKLEPSVILSEEKDLNSKIETNIEIIHCKASLFVQDDKNDNTRGTVLKYWFFLRLLNILGYKFELDSCVGCNLELAKTVKRVLFSVKSGGIVCNICKQNDFSEQNYSDAILVDYDLFLLIKRLSLDTNFCNNMDNNLLDKNIENKLNFFMNKVINYFLL